MMNSTPQNVVTVSPMPSNSMAQNGVAQNGVLQNPTAPKTGTFAKISKFFRGPPKLVRVTWKQSGEKDGWAVKAVDALVKKLKTQPNGIQKLEHALKTRDPNSECVTIPRSMDGRLQILNCKALPHVIYARVWRWPDLQNQSELKEVKNCQFPFTKGKRSEDVCINPYHYVRVENPNILPPILVPRISEFFPGHSKIPSQQVAGTSAAQPMDFMENITEPPPEKMPNNVTFSNNTFTVPSNGYGSQCSSGQSSPLSAVSNCQSNQGFQQQPQQQQQQQQQQQPNNAQYSSFTVIPNQNDNSAFPSMIQNDNSAFSSQNQNDNSAFPSMSQNDNLAFSSQNQNENYGYAQNQNQAATVVQVPYEEVDHWATVAYYELNHRVGEQFKCNSSNTSLIVDGYTQPAGATSNRFCLGQLSNVSRNSTIEATRRHIGKGIVLHCYNNELILECASDHPVFVQSPMTNYLHNFQSNVVCKIMPKQRLKIFNYNQFANLLSENVKNGFEATYGLTKMCTIRVSFVKGWGAQYHRQDITSTPCWVEVHLNGPLKWLDNILVSMGSPLYNITSVS